MKIAKSLIILVFCAVLSLAAFYCSYSIQPVTYGCGDGVNKSITSLEELQGLIYAVDGFELNDITQPQATSPRNATMSVAANVAAEEQDGTVDEGYKTLVYNQVSKISIDYKYSENSNSSSSSVDINRNLTVAWGDGCVYYNVDLLTTNSSKSNSSLWSLYLDMDMELYVDTSSAFVRFNRLVYRYARPESQSETLADREYAALMKYVGQWIDCKGDPDLMKALIDTNDSNIATLRSIGQFIEEALSGEEEIFKQNGSRYEVPENTIKNLIGISNNDSADIRFSGYYFIDLSTAEAPVVDYEMSSSVKRAASNTGKSTRNAYLRERLTFKFIDNTFVNFNTNINSVPYSQVMEEI